MFDYNLNDFHFVIICFIDSSQCVSLSLNFMIIKRSIKWKLWPTMRALSIFWIATDFCYALNLHKPLPNANCDAIRLWFASHSIWWRTQVSLCKVAGTNIYASLTRQMNRLKDHKMGDRSKNTLHIKYCLVAVATAYSLSANNLLFTFVQCTAQLSILFITFHALQNVYK